MIQMPTHKLQFVPILPLVDQNNNYIVKDLEKICLL